MSARATAPISKSVNHEDRAHSKPSAPASICMLAHMGPSSTCCWGFSERHFLTRSERPQLHVSLDVNMQIQHKMCLEVLMHAGCRCRASLACSISSLNCCILCSFPRFASMRPALPCSSVAGLSSMMMPPSINLHRLLSGVSCTTTAACTEPGPSDEPEAPTCGSAPAPSDGPSPPDSSPPDSSPPDSSPPDSSSPDSSAPGSSSSGVGGPSRSLPASSEAGS